MIPLCFSTWPERRPRRSEVYCDVTCPLTSREIPLVVVEAVGRVRRPVVMVSGGEVVLHEARPKAPKVVRRRRRLVEGRRLLVRRERASEVRRSLKDQ